MFIPLHIEHWQELEYFINCNYQKWHNHFPIEMCSFLQNTKHNKGADTGFLFNFFFFAIFRTL